MTFSKHKIVIDKIIIACYNRVKDKAERGKIMGRKKKIEQEDLNLTEENINDMDTENEMTDGTDTNNKENGRKIEILVGDKFKILKTPYNYEVEEWKKTKTKQEDGTEVEVEKFINHYIYYGTLKDICLYLKNYIATQKLHEKKTLLNLTEAIQIIKDSYQETNKLFEGIENF